VFDYGLDSVTTVMLAASLEDWLRVECNPEIVYEIPVIRRFAEYVAAKQGTSPRSSRT
jgi:acyl carrier protein